MEITRLTLKVVPGSSRNVITGWLGDALKVRVTQPPENGKANKAVISLLATALDIPAKHISICTGHTASTKVIEVQGISNAELRTKIDQLQA